MWVFRDQSIQSHGVFGIMFKDVGIFKAMQIFILRLFQHVSSGNLLQNGLATDLIFNHWNRRPDVSSLSLSPNSNPLIRP